MAGYTDEDWDGTGTIGNDDAVAVMLKTASITTLTPSPANGPITTLSPSQRVDTVSPTRRVETALPTHEEKQLHLHGPPRQRQRK